MAEAIVSFALEQLGSILSREMSGFIGKQVSLVGDVDEEVDKLKHNLRAIQAVLLDAEQKQLKNEAVRVWLDRLKDVCYEVEDVLDEWNTAILKLRIEGGHDPNALAPKKKVKELPQGMEKLVNLRRLQFVTVSPTLLYMPKGIEKLTGLRRLSEFVISGGSDHDNKACTLEGLKNLNQVEGSLTIRGLGNLRNVSDGELTEVFKKKEKLSQLILKFDEREEGERLDEDDELILKTLQPPPNLEDLWILYYRGNTFPSSWMTLTKLKVLRLDGCLNCKHLHHLGKLPLLELLDLYAMSSVKKVDNDFWGIDSETSSSSSLSVHFPKLKEFSFCNMEEWEEWDCKGEEFMPCLASLIIAGCPKLKALPDNLLQRTTLKELSFSKSPILSERYNKETGEDWPKISRIPYIEIDCRCVQSDQ